MMVNWKRRRLTKITLLLIIAAFWPQLLVAADFRGVMWGDDTGSVKGKETEKLIGDHPRNLIYQGRFAGIKMYIVYEFRNRRLVQGTYHNQSRHSDKKDFIRDQEILKNLLQKKYGVPLLDRVIWTDNTYRHDDSQWGEVLARGHLSYVAEWETRNTKISAMLWGKNSDIQHVIQYTERRTREKEKREREKRILEKL